MKNRKAFLTKFHELSRFANTCQNNINKMITYQVEENVSEERKKSPILLDVCVIYYKIKVFIKNFV